jgi:hypothetical protein
VFTLSHLFLIQRLSLQGTVLFIGALPTARHRISVHVEWDLAAHMENLMAWSILLLRTYNGDDLVSARGGSVKERERAERLNMSVKF